MPATPPDPTHSATAQTQALAAEAQAALTEASRRVELAVQEGIERLRVHSQAYAENAGQQIDEAGRYVARQVRDRPLAVTAGAVGVGVLIGLLLAAGRR